MRILLHVMYSLSDFQNPMFARPVMLQISNCLKDNLVWQGPSLPAMFANSRKDLARSPTGIS